MILKKEMTFDCAHMLPNHAGLCKNVHGHTYKIIAHFEGPSVETGSSEGMVIDFGDIKKALKVVTDQYDHAFIVGGYEPLQLIETLESIGTRIKRLPFRAMTTCEVMAPIMREQLDSVIKKYQPQVDCIAVELFETPTSSAVAYK